MWSISIFGLWCHMCWVSTMYWLHLEFDLLVLIACVCSLNHVRNALPVCQTYFRAKPLHFIRWILLLTKVSVKGVFSFKYLCIVLMALKDIHMYVFLNNLVMILASFPKVCEDAPPPFFLVQDDLWCGLFCVCFEVCLWDNYYCVVRFLYVAAPILCFCLWWDKCAYSWLGI